MQQKGRLTLSACGVPFSIRKPFSFVILLMVLVRFLSPGAGGGIRTPDLRNMSGVFFYHCATKDNVTNFFVHNLQIFRIG
jgi:hypothetical protein